MKRFALAAAAILSLLLVFVMCFGYFGAVRVGVMNHPLGGVTARQVDLSFNDGRIDCNFARVEPVPSTVPTGVHFFRSARVFPPRLPSLRRSIWEFDAHQLPIPGQPSMHRYIVACPIWCALVPLLITPAIWFVKSRRERAVARENAQGFSVMQAPAPVNR